MKELSFRSQKLNIIEMEKVKYLNDADNINQNIKDEKFEWNVNF